MSGTPKGMPAPLLSDRPFLFYLGARSFSEFSYQMAVVAMGWQVYAMTSSPFALGMIGLAQFVPTMVLTLIAGDAVDRYDRKRVAQICQLVEGMAAAILALGSFAGWLTVTHIFSIAAVFGTTAAFESPATAALLPGVVPGPRLQRATAVSTGSMQLATICGPALGGLAYAIAPWIAYLAIASFWLIAGLLNGAIKLERHVVSRDPPTLARLLAGVRFVRSQPAILGTISLDLFAVLLGGATALLPVYARDILHTGPSGLGLLRGAPALGALLMTALLARHDINHRLGMRMFQAVIIFGLGTVAFALSKLLILSLLALAIMGAADTVSVVIRTALVQIATPDAMRGRVSAVNFLFINASNQLGEFESGVTAALLGAMPAVVLGGVGTVIVALVWMRLFPALRTLDKLESPP